MDVFKSFTLSNIVITVAEYLQKLKFFFSENLLLAALDLVDRENGM